jgi:hypothetical protein
LAGFLKAGRSFRKDNANWIEVVFSCWLHAPHRSRSLSFEKTILEKRILTLFTAAPGTVTSVTSTIKLMIKDKNWYSSLLPRAELFACLRQPDY